MPTAQRGVDILEPIAEQPRASAPARRAYVEVLEFLGALQSQSVTLNSQAVTTLQHSMRDASRLGALDLSDMSMAAQYAESAGVAGAIAGGSRPA